MYWLNAWLRAKFEFDEPHPPVNPEKCEMCNFQFGGNGNGKIRGVESCRHCWKDVKAFGVYVSGIVYVEAKG